MKNILFIFFLPLWVFLSSSSAYAASDFNAKGIHITDGDTITALNDAKEQVKINGIDCPEKAKAYRNKAKEFTKDLVGWADSYDH